MEKMVTLNLTLPKRIIDYLDQEAQAHYLSRATVARQHLIEEVYEKVVTESRLRGLSIRRISETTGIPYLKVLQILAKTQIDEKLNSENGS